jgi:hypothetical protein
MRRAPPPQQLGRWAGQSAFVLQRMTPADPAHCDGVSHVVARLIVETQHTLPWPHWAELEQLNDAPIEHICPAAMHVAPAPCPGTT